MANKKFRPLFKVTYETRWTHPDLKPEQGLEFKAETPIEDIVEELQNSINKAYPGLNKQYLPSSVNYFGRLYRNKISQFHGWQVGYRKPGDPGPYQPITEQIGVRKTSVSSAKPALKHTMRWRHQLYPYIDEITIGPVNSGAQIVRALNNAVQQARLEPLFEKVSSSLRASNANYRKVEKKNLRLDLLEDNVSWQTFSKNLETTCAYCQQINSRNRLVNLTNISDILRSSHPYKTTKGWTVEFLDVS